MHVALKHVAVPRRLLSKHDQRVLLLHRIRRHTVPLAAQLQRRLRRALRPLPRGPLRPLQLVAVVVPLLHQLLALHLRRRPRRVEILTAPSELLTAPSELLESPSELSASPSELLASPSELLTAPSELLTAPSELLASPNEL
jgi:hypothetical protein